MAFDFIPHFKDEVSEAVFDSDGKTITLTLPLLDEIARNLDLKPLSGFGDNRQVPEDFDGDIDDLEEMMGEYDEWHSISDCISTIDGLIQHIRSNKSDVETEIKINYSLIESSDFIIDDLEELHRCMVAAKSQTDSFRFEYF
ncbi:hypothetical protein ACFLU6_06130 [Acidobacteriota bacterium]